MKIISHRGNICGPSDNENKPEQILYTISQSYDCEVDVWLIGNNFYLGHDEPVYPVNVEFLTNKKLWCHAKNLQALQLLAKYKCKYFWHESDKYVLTSNKKIWTYPNNVVSRDSIIVDLNSNWRDKQYQCFGVCVDWV